jgi:hypothetical protein
MRCAIAIPPSVIISKKLEGFSEKPGKEREFRNARAFANPFPGTLRRHALDVVSGDQPDCPVRHRGPPIRDFFQKIDSDFAAQGRQGRFLSAAPCLLLRATRK